MKKMLISILFATFCVLLAVGCNSENNVETSEVMESVVNEVISDELSTESSETVAEVSTEELTIEEKILAEMPAKLEVPEGYEPVPVTKEMIMERYEEIKITEGPLTVLKFDNGDTYAEAMNEYYISALLTLNASYMDPEEFNELTNEFCPDMYNYQHYVEDWGWSHSQIVASNFYNGYCGSIDKNSHGELPWGEGYCSATPDKLLFDPYLINQAEQINYLMYHMQMDEENQEAYYRIIENYLYLNQNEHLTFDYDYEHIYGSGLASLQCVAQTGKTYDCMLTYNLELRSQWWESEDGINVLEEVSDDLYAVMNEIE